ncbi:MAG: hypothetical protein ACRDL6_09525 [Solirubrobacterales bacterium]
MSSGKHGVVTAGVVAFGLYLLGISLFGVVAPGTFFDELGRFGPRNDHYIHDVAAFQAAAGLLLLLSVRWRSWRVPALLVAALQFGLHALSHLVDLGDADPRYVGVLELVALTLATGALIWLLVLATRSQRYSPS